MKSPARDSVGVDSGAALRVAIDRRLVDPVAIHAAHEVVTIRTAGNASWTRPIRSAGGQAAGSKPSPARPSFPVFAPLDIGRPRPKRARHIIPKKDRKQGRPALSRRWPSELASLRPAHRDLPMTRLASLTRLALLAALAALGACKT